ncbi:MAG: serine/threonine protein kinase [Actinomycetota bacterium]|nr:serine/threonine protein kinase [Actinomycetota bacterium]
MTEVTSEEATVLGNRYRLERRLGQGGMSEVWLATDLALDRKVAVKWLKPTLATDTVVAERFRREAIAVARLNHPNIVAVHDAFEHEGRQAVVMQLVDGKSLRQLLDVQIRLSPELTVHIGSCVAVALDAAHRAGFVHRDVKPGNIMLTADGRVMLTDFGIAKGLDSVEEDLTSPNIMMGTAKYLSPEQVRGRKLDGRADLYSLGLVLYECLAGRVPFLGETDADTALARLQRDPTDLTRLRPTIPRGLVVLIHRLLSRNPNQRPATGADLRSELAVIATEPPIDLDGPIAEPPGRFESEVRPTGRELIPGQPVANGHDEPTERQSPATIEQATTQSEPTRTASPVRDHTPSHPIRAKPGRGLQQRYLPSAIVVGVLLLLAALMAVLLWVMLGTDDDTGSQDRLSVAGSQPPATSGVTNAAGEPRPQATVEAVVAYDPAGNGVENDDQAADALADGDPTTEWQTVCYASAFMSKPGVGLVLTLDQPSVGTVEFEVLSAPYQVDVFAGDEVPAQIDGWGAPVAETSFADEPGTLRLRIDERARHVLILFRELGPDEGCTGANPYRGRLGEVSFTP